MYSDDHHLSVEYTGVCDMCTTLLHYKDPPLFMRSELYCTVFSMVFAENRFSGLPEKTKSSICVGHVISTLNEIGVEY